MSGLVKGGGVRSRWPADGAHCTVSAAAGGQVPGPCAGRSMKVGIFGFAGSGKRTVFQWLSGGKPDPAQAQVGQPGKARIPDPRLDWLSAQFQPRKTTPADLEFLDTPGLLPSERRDTPRRLGILRESGGLLVVLN